MSWHSIVWHILELTLLKILEFEEEAIFEHYAKQIQTQFKPKIKIFNEGKVLLLVMERNKQH